MFTEREKVPSVPEGINVRQEDFIPETIEAVEGVKVISQQQNITAVTNTGNIQTAKDDAVTVTIPADPQVLQQTVKKGNVVDSATWLAAFWFRTFKKALHFGWKVVQK